jgi:carbonic anhydrase/acetyltransferase-like protein (isoleucine patch superfamily)
MPLYSFQGTSPTIAPTAFIAPTAVLVGDVTVEEEASVWYNAVLRGDAGPIVVRAGANVQDGSVLHARPGGRCEIGPGATIGHLCVVHGATIGEEALVGNGTTVLDDAVVGRRTLVAAGSLVTAGAELPDEVVAMGQPAKVKGPLAGATEEWVRSNPAGYRHLAQLHKQGIAEL